jgi:hypothetical protein
MPIGEKFSVQKYTSDAGGIYSLRISNDFYLAAPNLSIAGAYTDKRVRVTASNHGNKRKAGLHARGFILGLPAVSPATGYTSRTFMPVNTASGWAGKNIGENVTVNSVVWEILDKVQET